MFGKNDVSKGGDNVRGNFTTDRHGELNPNYKDGRKGTRLYSIYRDMITRCYNSNTPNYKRYGARGITMCDIAQS